MSSYDDQIQIYMASSSGPIAGELQVLPIQINQQFYAFSFTLENIALAPTLSTQIKKIQKEWNRIFSVLNMI